MTLGVLLLVLTSCSPSAPTPVASPGNNNSCTITGGGTCVIGDGSGNVTNPTPNPSASPGGDNVVTSFPIFCYGFGAQPGQPEPNHNACILPPGYPNIAITASPKNKAGTDIPNPGDITSDDIIDWRFDVTPAGAATLTIQGDNRFNVRVTPAENRVSGTVFTVTAIYTDPDKKVWVTTKSGGIN
jgi:hypothetical protein